MATTPKKVTVSELKTFIEAVEFAADTEEWIPSKRQWLRIREMINVLVDTQVERTVQQPQQIHLPLPSGPMQMAPGGLGAGLTPPGPIQIPQGVPMAGTNPAMPVKTPDIDTTRGNYTSSFA
jgi:hypothetical protein